MTVQLETRDYVIRFAYRRGDPDSNLPIAFDPGDWYQWETLARQDDSRWQAIQTVTGQAIELRRADCGAGCRCALEWRATEV